MLQAEPQRIFFDLKFAIGLLSRGQTAEMMRPSSESRARGRASAARTIHAHLRLWEIFEDVAGVMTPVDREAILAAIDAELAATSRATWEAFRAGNSRNDVALALTTRLYDRLAPWTILVNEPSVSFSSVGEGSKR